MNPCQAYIGLGANLGDARATLCSAVIAISRLPGTRLSGLSSLYRSAPIGPAGQPDYLNAVARVTTTLIPHQLLDALQAIEKNHGRTRAERWGPRTLDLDLLLFGNDLIETSELIIPHPELANRNFVLAPLLQIDSAASLPDGRRLADFPTASDVTGLRELAPDSRWAIDAGQ